MSRLTIKDIAALAGVGKSTVSRYFNGGYVKEDTRQRIAKVIEEQHYSPNVTAQSLKAKHSYQVAIITPTIESYTTARVVTAMDEQLRSFGYTPVIYNTNHNEERELMSLVSLSRINVEGAILMATEITQDHIKLVSQLDMPFLYVAQESPVGTHISLDDYLAGYKIGRTVAEAGHRHVTYIGVDEKDIAVGRTRKNGVYAGLKDGGVTDITFLLSDFTYEHSRTVIREALKQTSSTAFLCATDTIAMAAYHEIQDIGKKIPEDYSITGFGGYDSSAIMTPPLCTIRFNYEEEGTAAAEMMIEMIQGKAVQSEKIGFEFIAGNSVRDIH